MFRGNKVVVRAVAECDLDLLAQWRSAPEIRQFFFTPWPIYPGAQKKWYESLINDRTRMLWMVDTLDGRTVGMIGIAKIEWHVQECEVGPGIIIPEERGQGYIEEALDLVIRYCFEELNLQRIYALCYPFNQVIELAKYFGFQQEGVLRRAAFTQGKFYDKILLSLLREEWLAEIPVSDSYD